MSPNPQSPADAGPGSRAPIPPGASSGEFAALFTAEHDGVVFEDASGQVTFANEAVAHLLGAASSSALQGRAFAQTLGAFQLFDEHGANFPVEQLPGNAVRRGRYPPPMELRMLAPTGEERWLRVSAQGVGEGKVLTLARDVTGHRRAVKGLRLIADASALLASSLDYVSTLPRLARRLVPELVDGCTVEVVGKDGKLRPLATEFADAVVTDAALEQRRRYPEPSEAFFESVMQAGQPVLRPRPTDEVLQESAVDEEHLRLLRAVGPRVTVTVPLIARGRTLGVMGFAGSRSGQEFDEATLAILKELASRVALAVDDARLIQDLESTRERLHLALDEGRMWYFELDLRTREAVYSPSFSRIVGMNDTSQDAFFNILHPADRPVVEENMRRLMELGERALFTYRIIRPDTGQVRWIEGLTKLIRDEAGRPLRTFGFRMDVTERKEAEASIRRSEEQLRLALNATRMGIFDWDMAVNATEMSPSCQAIMGMVPGTYDGTYEMFLRCLHPDDREPFVRAMQAQLESPGEPAPLKYRVVHPSGEVRYIESHGQIVRGPDGKVTRVLGVIIDVTESKRAEENLRQSEEQLRLVLSAGRTGFFDWNLTTGKGTFSESYQAMLGMVPGSFDGTAEAFARRVHPADLEGVMSYAAKDLDDSILTFRAVHDDGSVRWVEIHSRSHRDANRRMLRMFGVAVDITERKEAEAQARQLAAEQAARAETEAAHQRIAAILDSISEPLFALDPQWRFRFLNRAAEQMVGDTVTGRSAREVPPFRDAPALLASCEKAMREEGHVEHEVELPGGRWYELRARPYEQGLSVYLRDVTARRREHEVQARLASYDALRADIATIWATQSDVQASLQRCTEAVVQHLGVSFARIWLVDEAGLQLELKASAGKYTHLNGAHARIPVGRFKIGRIAQQRQPHISNDVVADPEVNDPQWARREGMVSFAGLPLVVDQRLLGVMALFAPHTLPNDTIAGLSAIVDSVAHGLARRRAEQELAEHAAQLARSNSDLEQFAYVASHDLQEPLRVVASFTQLLAQRYQGKLDEKADRYINFAVDGANRMQRLIQDLLTYSRVGAQSKDFGPVDGGVVLRRVLTNLEATIAEVNAEVTSDALPTVMGDEIQLEQLLQNLVGNALKFRGQAPARVHVSVRREGSEWVFAVRDNGIGIEPQYYQRIFVIFQRLHGKAKYAGTGIGLAICKKIVERHGGRIWVESAPEQGSTFFFTLPASLGGEADQRSA